MKTLDFVKLSPAQNMTILVLSEVNQAEQPSTASNLMRSDRIGAEQVGFVELSDIAEYRLQMMGGEFCGNATASLAACLCATTDRTDFNLEVSGADSPVKCHVENRNGEYIVTVDMPLPLNVDEIMLPELSSENLTIVSFPGITHIIMENKPSELTRSVFSKLCQRLNQIAIGVIVLNESKMFISPAIYVSDTDQIVYERGCGSGSAAVGAYLANKYGKSVSVDVCQQGGTINVCAELGSDNKLKQLAITVPVFICARGTAYL